MTVALRTVGLSKSFGAFKANSDITLSFDVGRAPRAHRPQWRGQDNVHQSADRSADAQRGRGIPGRGESNVTCRSICESRRGMTRTFQINTLFPGVDRAGVGDARVLRARRRGIDMVAHSVGGAAADRRSAEDSRVCCGSSRTLPSRRATSPTASSVCWRSRLRSRRDPRCCCSTSPRRGFRPRKAPSFSASSRACPRTCRIVFIEHDMNLVFKFAEKITVLVGGAVLVEGTPEEIARDRRVREVYLGEAEHA